MAFYRPATAPRQAALQPSVAALLFVDVQRYNCSKDGAIYQSLSEEERQASDCCVRPSLSACIRTGGRRALGCSLSAQPSALAPCLQSEGVRHFFQRVEECAPLWARLQRACQ